MAFSLPGLGLSAAAPSLAAPTGYAAPFEAVTRTENLGERAEWRFEVAHGKQYDIKVVSGTAEIWGTELLSGQVYTFGGYKGAVFTWYGCSLEITGEAESEYTAQETDYAVEWLSVHGMLETLRDEAQAGANQGEGPRVLVVGPDHVGKSSLIKTLAAWGVKVGRTPTVLNLDPREGLLVPPGSLTAVTVAGQTEVESGYGVTPVSAPTTVPIKTPLVYHWPYTNPAEKTEHLKSLLTSIALHVTGKLEAQREAKYSGLIIDTSGSFNDPKSNYDILNHIMSEFSITLVLTIGSERLYNDLNRRFGQARGDDKAIPVLRLTKPGGAIERDAAFMRQLRAEQCKQYFYGPPNIPLNPHQHPLEFREMDVFRIKTSADDEDDDTNFQPGLDDDPDFPFSNEKALFEKVAPSAALMSSFLAIKHCSGDAAEGEIRDSAVLGYLHVASVDETKQRMRVLAPLPQKWGDKALVWAGFPEAMADVAH